MNKIFQVVLLLFVAIISVKAQLQQANTMYYMDRVVQSGSMNPAKQYPCKFFIGAPGLAPVQITVSHSGATVNDAFYYVDEIDSTVNFLHPKYGDEAGFLKAFQKVNFVSSEISYSLLSMGFRANRYYLTFDIQDRYIQNFSYPSDIMTLALDGNKQDQLFELNGFNYDFTAYREAAFGVSEQINDQWTFGARLKILFGLASVRSDINMLEIQTGLDKWSVPSGLQLNASIPTAQVYVNDNGQIDSLTNTLSELSDEDMIKYATNFNNMGGALDFGGYFRPNEKWEFSASLIDLGSIMWKSNPINLTQQSEFSFNGLNMSKPDSIDTDEFQSMVDSIKFNVTNNYFSTPLNTKFYLGARYNLTDKFSLGFLTRQMVQRGRLRPQFSWSANINDKFISASFSYSIMNNSYNNFGLGLNFKVGPFNMYFMSDNVPLQYSHYSDDESSYLIPYRFKTLNFRLGLNLIFGCKDISRDKPITY